MKKEKKNKSKILAGCGLFCILLLLISSWYAITFNDSRLVTMTDFGSYRFRTEDLPMILSVSLTCVYVCVLFVMLLMRIAKRGEIEKAGTTRKVNPRLGFLGLLGFLGFAGFWTYSARGVVFPFVFFLFFGFFGFFYEGKMSGTFMDERFRENEAHAKLKAYRITFSITFAALIILCQGKLFGSLEYSLIAMIIVISLASALGIFLSEYLLYRYDHDDLTDES